LHGLYRLLVGFDAIEGDVEHTVDAGDVALEVVLAPEEASADVAWEAGRQPALVPHVPHQVVVGGVGAVALRTNIAALVVGRVLFLAGRRTAPRDHRGRRRFLRT